LTSHLSISIVLYKNDIAQVEKLVSCIAGTTIPYKIYFIDNSPTDILRHKLKKIMQPGNEYISTGKNVGYGAAHNIALKQAINHSEYHLVVNPDIQFGKGVLEQIYYYMELNKTVGQLIPKVLDPDGRLQYVCKLIPTPFDLASRLLPGFLFKKYKETFELRFSGYDKIMNIPYLHGCFMFLRCSALREVGLFDERFFMYPEDIDFTRRMHTKYETIFYPYAQVYHDHARSSFKNMRMFAIHAYNITKYFNKWGWLFDSERTKTNKAVLQQVRHLH
jgi:GT2 family glycosyltransferase